MILGEETTEDLARVFWESFIVKGFFFFFLNFAEEENDCKVFIVKPSQSVFAYGSSQQQGLHTVTGEFFEVGTPREEREEPKGLGPPYKLNPASTGIRARNFNCPVFPSVHTAVSHFPPLCPGNKYHIK